MPPGPAEIDVAVPAGLLRRRRELRQSARGRPRRSGGPRPTIARRSPASRLLGDGLRRRRRKRAGCDLHARGRAAVRRPPVVGTGWLLTREGIPPTRCWPPAGKVPVRGDGGATSVAGPAEWCPACELVEHGSAAEVEALEPATPRAAATRGRGSTRTPGTSAPAASSPRSASPRTRRPARRRCRSVRPARPPDRGPPGARLGDPRPPPRRRDGRDRRAGGGGLKVPGDRPTNQCPRRGSNSRPTD